MTQRIRRTGLIVTVGLITICLTLNVFIAISNENGIRGKVGMSTGSSPTPVTQRNRLNQPIARAVDDLTGLVSPSQFVDSDSFVKNVSRATRQATGPVHAAVKVVDWQKTAMSTLSASQIVDYLLWTNQPSCQIAQYFGGRMVASADGLSVALDGQKAVCLDSAVAPTPDRCVVYSFGISNEWSFDEAMELYGCQIFSFDPSMNVSDHNRTEAIHFYQMALDDVDKDEWNEDATVLSRTLSSIYDMLRPVHGDDCIIDYLKMDIEATEWRVLPQMMESGMMDKVRQLAVEIHLDSDKSLSVYRQQAGILQSLEDYGMVRFDSKRNMFTVVDFTQVANLAAAVDYEMAWYNRRLSRI